MENRGQRYLGTGRSAISQAWLPGMDKWMAGGWPLASCAILRDLCKTFPAGDLSLISGEEEKSDNRGLA